MTGTIESPPTPRRRPVRVPDDGVDPRMARRRQAVRGEARRRRLRVAAAVGAAIALVAAGVLVTRSSLLDVDRVAVVGATHVPRQRIVSASGIAAGDALVDVDLVAARRRVMALPGVSSARVTVEWPDTVRIRVTEDRPSVSLVLPGATFEVARGGWVMARTADALAGLPTLATELVPASSLRPGHRVPDVLADALVVFEQMPASVRPQLAAASLDRDGSLTFRLEGGGAVRFGPPEEVPAKLLAAASMLGGAVVTDCLDVLDLREPTRPTISRRAGCSVSAPTVGATTTTVAPSSAGRAPSTTRSTTPSTTRTTTAGRGR